MAISFSRVLTVAQLGLFGLLLSPFMVQSGYAQDEPDPDPDVAPNVESERVIELPPTLADGREIWGFKVFQGQLIDLIPSDYRPVDVERLSNAINERIESTPGEQDVRLRSAIYEAKLVDQALVCQREQSKLILEIQHDDITKLNLGPCNLAITPPTNDPATRLESDGKGNTIAVVAAAAIESKLAEIDFSWSKRGKPNGIRTDFLLRVPRATRARMVLTVPEDVVVETDNGVLRGPSETNESERIYEIDFGGLSQLRISVFRKSDLEKADTIAVCDSNLRYQIDSAGIRWVHQMTVQSRGGERLPELVVSGGTVSSITIDQVAAKFESTKRNDGLTEIQLANPLGGSPSTTHTSNVVVRGEAILQTDDNWNSLPRFFWSGRVDSLPTHASSGAELIVQPPMRVVDWQLPEGWKQQLADDQTILAIGPPDDFSEPDVENNPDWKAWSHVRLIEQTAVSPVDVLLEIKPTTKVAGELATLDVKALISIPIDPQRVQPVQIEIEKGWDDVSLTLQSSQRVIPVNNVRPQRIVSIWPDTEDIVDGNLLVQATASRSIPTNKKRTAIPSLWAIRVRGVPNALTAAITPPEDLNWYSDTVLKSSQIAKDSLSELQADFFGELPDESLLFQPSFGRLPTLALQPPDISFDVQTSLQVSREGNEINEQISVEARSASQRIRDVVGINIGVGEQKSQYRWSLRGEADTLPLNLPSRVVEFDSQTGTYQVDLRERNLRGKRLVGRRKYQIEGNEFELRLPIVAQSASQAAEVLIGPGLMISSTSGRVDRVPSDRKELQANSQQVRLRYDPGGSPQVRLRTNDADPNVTIIWHQDVNVTASSRGGDIVTALLKVSSSRPIRIGCDADLRLVSLTKNSRAINTDSVPRRPIILLPDPGVNVIRLAWSRSVIQGDWIRSCRIPTIRVDGVSVQSKTQLTAAHDTFAPISVFQPTTGASAEGQLMDVSASGEVLLIHRNLAIAIGWLFSILVFALTWIIARRSLLLVLVAVGVSSTLAVMWWPWQLAIVGWLIVPAVTAALLVTIQRFRNQIAKPSDEELPVVEAGDTALEFSYNTGALLFLVASAMTSTSFAQEPIDSASPKPVHVLVPTDADGQQVGDKVYVPNDLYTELFGSKKNEVVADANIENAQYRVQIPNSVTSQPEVQVDLGIRVPKDRALQVRLPFESQLVRRVELRQGDQTRIISSRPAPGGGVFVPIPPGQKFDLRLTLFTLVQQTGPVMRMQLAVPPLANAKLAIGADRGVDNVNILTAEGKIDAEPAIRQWQVDLGKIDELIVEYQFEDDNTVQQNVVVNKNFWVRISESTTIVEGELDPGPMVRLGQRVNFEVIGLPPKIISPGWQLQRQSMLGVSRHLLTVVKQTESNEPIRIAWNFPTVVNDPTSPVDSVPMSMPLVSVSQFEDVGQTSYAIQFEDGLVVNETGAGKELEISQFLEQWKGFGLPALIKICFEAAEDAPSLTVLKATAANPRCTQTHIVKVDSERLLVRYSAMITGQENNVTRRTLLVPKDILIHSLLVDGLPVPIDELNADNRREVVLGMAPKSILLEGEITQARATSKFSTPHLKVLPPLETEETYRVNRAPFTNLSFNNQRSDIQPIVPLIQEDDLKRSQIPVALWAGPLAVSDQPTSTFAKCVAKPLDRKFGCSEILGITYEDGVWKLKAELTFTSKNVPELVFVSMPRRWCQSISLPPDVVWLQSESTDPAKSLLRIATSSLTSNRVQINSELENSEQGGISVPQVLVLDNPDQLADTKRNFGSRRISVSVPANQWKLVNVQATELPQEARDRLNLPANQQEFAVRPASVREQWLLELLPTQDVQTNILTSDTQVFLQEDDALVLCRWDIVPGSMDSVGVLLPQQAKCLGAWSAHRSVTFDTLPVDIDGGQQELVRVPLSLSKLSQAVELFVSIPVQTSTTTEYVPRLARPELDNEKNVVFLDSDQSWLSIHRPEGAESDRSERNVSKSEANTQYQQDVARKARAYSLANSIVLSIDSSLDTLTEMPKAEVSAWLAPWSDQYDSLALSVGHQVHWDDSQDDDAASNTPGDFKLTSVKWNDLDRRMGMYRKRFLKDKYTASVPLFSPTRFSGYKLQYVGEIQPGIQAEPIKGVSAEMRALRSILRRSLTILMTCGLMMILWPFRRHATPIVSHPAFWLGVLAVACLFVAPISVAIALIGLAVVTTIANRAFGLIR